MITSIDDNVMVLAVKGHIISTPGKLRKKIGSITADNDIVNFGDHKKGEKLSKKIIIHNITEDTLNISAVELPEGIYVEISPDVLKPSEYGELNMIFDSHKSEYGKINSFIKINIEAPEITTTGQIKFFANIIEDFSLLTAQELVNAPVISIDNNTIFLKDLPYQKVSKKIVYITNKGTRDLKIRNIQTTDDRFSVEPSEFAIQSGKSSSFTINIKPEKGDKKLKSTVTVISNDPERSRESFTIVADVIASEDNYDLDFVIDVKVFKASKIIKSFADNDDFVILDVRTKPEYTAGCLSEAVNIDYKAPDFRKIISLLDKNKIYLVYCKSGFRSLRSIEIMAELGFENIYHMQEGFDGWKAQGLEWIYPDK
ncbi:MAG: DUF1573 domain-containing protein [Candidatus Cloacimonetes bacterium]|nr:DUF1573 domain-containing protein [Candidatus Cloacimonadota bacterium]